MGPTQSDVDPGRVLLQLLSELRAAHTRGEKGAGLDMINGTLGDMAQMGVVESFQVRGAAMSIEEVNLIL